MFVLGCAVATGVSLGSAQAGPSPSVGPDTPLGGSGYGAITHARLLDTRLGASTVDGLELGAGPLGPNGVLDLSVLGRGGVPATGVDSVAVHITAVLQTQPTFVTVYPTGGSRPNTSNLNPTPGVVASNLVIVPVGAGGKVSLYNSSGSVHLIVDVLGWFPSGGELTTVTPTRLADTRSTSKVGAGQSLPVQVAGLAGVPTTGVSAVVLNVTTTAATLPTFLTVHPSGTAVPGTSNLNTQLGNTAANLVITPMGADGKVAIRNQAGAVHVIVDVIGWFAEGPGYNPVTPTRIADTRSSSPLPPNSSTTFDLTGVAGVPSTGVGSVVFNLTAVNQTARTYLTVYPSGAAIPVASSLNPHPGIVAPNLVIAKVGPGGIIKIYNYSGTVDVILDVVGWLPSNVVAAADALTVAEDDPFTIIEVLANDIDLDGHDLKIQSVPQPAHGTAAVVNAGLSVSYKPGANYCNSPGGPADTFTYTLFGGATATVSVTVTCVDDLPVAVDDDATVAEDAAATDIPVLANDMNVDGGPITINAITQPANGTAIITGGGTGVSYTPDANFCSIPVDQAEEIGYTLNGGCSATASVIVVCVDDAPVAVADPLTVSEDAPATAVAVLANDLDVDGGPKSVASVTQPTNGTVVITGVGAGLTYAPNANSCNDPPGSALDTFSYTLNGGSATTVTVTVTCINDAPTFTKGADQSVLEDSGAQSVIGWATAISRGPANESTQTVAFTVTGNTNPGLFSGSPSIASNGVLTYTPAANANGTATITLSVSDNGGTANGGVDTSAAQTFMITVTAVNDAPSFDLPAAPDQAVIEDSAAQTVAAFATNISKGPANESGQVLTFNVSNDNNSLFSVQPDISESTGDLVYTPASGTTGTATVSVYLTDDGGTANGGDDASATVMFDIVVFPPNATPVAQGQTGGSAVSTLEDTPVSVTLTATDADDDNLTFAIVGAPSNGALGPIGAVDCTTTANTCTASVAFTPSANFNGATSFTFKANDATIDSNTATVAVNVTSVNDAPSFTKGGNETVPEDSGAQSVVGWATAINKGATNESAQMLTFGVTGNTSPLLFSVAPAVSSAGTLTYTPAANANGAATITLGLSDDGGTASGGVDSSVPQTFTITVTSVNDEPSFTKGGDQSVAEDGGAQSVPGWATAISKGSADEAGQTLTFNVTGNTNAGLFSVAPAVASNGTVTYTSAANRHGAATITLTLSDNGGTANGGDDTSPSQSFTITVNAVNDAPTSPGRAYGAGSLQANMQRSFDAASGLLVGAADAADIVGNAGYTPTLSVGAIEGITPVAGTITAVVPNVGTVVANAATGSFMIDPAPGVTGTVDFDFTVCDTGDGAPATQCSATASATFDIAGPVIWFVNPVAVSNGVGTLASPFNTLAAADAVDAANHRVFVYNGTTTSGLALNSGEWLIGQTATGPFDGLFGIAPPAGTLSRPTMGSGATTIGGTVTLAANARVQGAAISTGTSAGLVGTGGITGISVSEASVITTTGTAVSLDSAAGTYSLSNVTTSGAANGILLNNLGASDVTVTGGTVVNATTRGVDISGGTGAFTFGGTITTTSTGRSVEVTNRTGGTATFNGSITDSGLGVNLATNTGSTVNFTGGVVVNSGANSAFAATGGGIVSVAGATNTLSTTTGIALNVANTNIGAANLNFRSISANGATNGIVLNTTGASGRLIVSGNGGTCTLANTAGCTGGEIRNSTGGDDSSATPIGTGIVLKDTLNPSFTRVWVRDHSNYAIRGTNVTGFTLTDSVISGTNGSNDASPFRDASVAFDNLTGSAAVSTSNIAGGAADNFRAINTSGSLNRLTFTSVTVGANGANGNDGVLLTSSGTATFNVTIQNSTFTSARGDLLQYIHGGTGTGDLVLTGNAFSNNHPGIATGGGGLSLSNEGTSGATTMTIIGNTFHDAVGHGVLIVKGTGPSTQTGTFSGNTIGVTGLANSGSSEGSGLKLQSVGQGTLTWAVTNNTIFGYNNHGIEVLAGGGATLQSGALNTTITGNIIAQPGNTVGTQALSKNGIHLNIGTVPGDTYQACAAIGGAGGLANSIATSGLDGVPPTGAGDNDFRLRQRQSTTIRLPGYAGANNNDAAVLAFVAGNNGGNGVPVGLASNTVPTGGGFTGTGTGCP